jgi:hypothetical protein
MPKGTMCNCLEQPDLVDISNNHSEFKSKLSKLEVGKWVLLMSCPDCEQLWKVDEWDKYQNCFAFKIHSREDWEAFDSEALVKELMVKKRGGLTDSECLSSGCSLNQVKGSLLCQSSL